MAIVEQILVNVIANELSLASGNVWIASNNRKIPNNNEIYISVGMVDATVIGNNNTIEPTEYGMQEVQQVVTKENIQIDIFSASDNAILRRYEIISALKSFYCQQQMEENNVAIFQIPTTFVNSSGAEGGSGINRFTIIVACHTMYRNVKALSSEAGDYYDEFSTRVDDANTIENESGLFEFTEPESTA